MAILRRNSLGQACVLPPVCVLGLEMKERTAAEEVVVRARVAGGGKLLGIYCVSISTAPPTTCDYPLGCPSQCSMYGAGVDM